MAWEYQRQEQKFEVIPEGEHRVRIKSADFARSSNGRDMIALQFDVSGYTGTLYNYIVFLEDHPEITNRRLTEFYDSFPGIEEGNTTKLSQWVGKTGACVVKHEDFNGKTSAKIARYIPARKQDSLPAWKEPGSGKPSSATKTDSNGFIEVDFGNDEMPFTF